jgi:hypothetical protein
MPPSVSVPKEFYGRTLVLSLDKFRDECLEPSALLSCGPLLFAHGDSGWGK